jgi:hypothetical protein
MEGPEGTGPLQADMEVLKQVRRHVKFLLQAMPASLASLARLAA